MIAEVINRALDRRQAHGLNALNESERVMAPVFSALFRYFNGGFESLFSEPATGPYIQETSWALRQIGAPDVATLLLDAARLVPNEDDLPALQQADLAEAFEALWSSGAGGDVEALLDHYIEAHLHELTLSRP